MEAMGRVTFLYFLLLVAISSCGIKKRDQALGIIRDVQQEYVPDGRTGIFTIEVIGINPVVLRGETNLVAAKATLLNKFSEAGFTVKDDIILLPDAQIGDKKYGLINLSVANLRSKPAHSAELVTQALLGTPVSILKKEDDWFLIQTPDQYIAWTENGSLVPVTEQEFVSWKKSQKIIYLNTSGFALDSAKTMHVSDLVTGDVLATLGQEHDFWKVIYPDGRKARIAKSEVKDLQEWYGAIAFSDSSIIQMAESLLGIPYLWGGTSTKGVDCSGFTKTVYFMQGLILPRDASQQVFAGELVDTVGDFSKLLVGDLLFFGRKNEDQSERVIHVGLWLGNNQFIHSSTDVHISSMDSNDANFDPYNHDRYLRTKRIIGQSDRLVSDLADYY